LAARLAGGAAWSSPDARGPKACVMLTRSSRCARRGRLVTRARREATRRRTRSCTTRLARRPATTKVLAWRRRARGHEWPESSARARRGSSAARRPATRQGDTRAHSNAVGTKQSKVQGGRKGIRWLRWCSSWGGGVVEAGSRTAMAWRGRRSRRRTVPCSGPAPFSDTNGLPFFSRTAVVGGVLGGSTAFPAV
jgi:hypothetical protein